jgi:hypothetical protein
MLVYTLLVYLPLVITRLLVCSFARVLVCSCARVLVCSCARVLVCSCARMLLHSQTRPRGAIHLLDFILNVYLPPNDYI